MKSSEVVETSLDRLHPYSFPLVNKDTGVSYYPRPSSRLFKNTENPNHSIKQIRQIVYPNKPPYKASTSETQTAFNRLYKKLINLGIPQSNIVFIDQPITKDAATAFVVTFWQTVDPVKNRNPNALRPQNPRSWKDHLSDKSSLKADDLFVQVKWLNNTEFILTKAPGVGHGFVNKSDFYDTIDSENLNLYSKNPREQAFAFSPVALGLANNSVSSINDITTGILDWGKSTNHNALANSIVTSINDFISGKTGEYFIFDANDSNTKKSLQDLKEGYFKQGLSEVLSPLALIYNRSSGVTLDLASDETIKGVQYPPASNTALVDSYIVTDRRKIGISSKSGSAGGKPAVASLLAKMDTDEMAAKSTFQLLKAEFIDKVEFVKKQPHKFKEDLSRTSPNLNKFLNYLLSMNFYQVYALGDNYKFKFMAIQPSNRTNNQPIRKFVIENNTGRVVYSFDRAI